MKSKSLIIVLILIIILFGGYIGYDLLVIHKEDSKNEYNDKAVVVSAYDGVNTIFIKASDSCNLKDSNLTSVVSIPKLVKDTKNANEFNKKIYNQFKNDIELSKGIKSDNYDYVRISYDYTVVNSIVYIWVERFTGGNCVGSSNLVYDYYYDLKNDKELTTKDVYNINNVTIDDVFNEFRKKHPEENTFISYITYPIMPTLDNLGFNIYLYNLNSYIGKDGNLIMELNK